jgi:hypothetical protein
MTTRSKTRKAPTAKPAMHETFGSLPYDASTASISKLIARLRFLEADCQYNAAVCDPVMRLVVLNNRHRGERDEIMQRLAKTVPDDFDDAVALLIFATSRVESAKPFDDARPVIAMLKHASEGFYQANGKARANFILRALDERLEHFTTEAA